MKRRAALALLLALASAGVLADAASCAVEGEMLSCDLRPGETQRYDLDGSKTKLLKLRNASRDRIQITEVRVRPVLAGTWGEYCVTLRDLSMHQKEAGYGEVGCAHKGAGEREFAPLRWGGPGAGLDVQPGMTVYVGGYVHSPAGKDHRKTVQVTIARDAVPVLAYRQPREDVIIRCSGTSEATAPGPWRNETGGNLLVTGATIFAADVARNDAVDAACIEVRGADGATIKWRHCEGLQRRGEYRFSPVAVAVAPGEYIAGQAHNRCAKGQWDWAAYISVCAAAPGSGVCAAPKPSR